MAQLSPMAIPQSTQPGPWAFHHATINRSNSGEHRCGLCNLFSEYKQTKHTRHVCSLRDMLISSVGHLSITTALCPALWSRYTPLRTFFIVSFWSETTFISFLFFLSLVFIHQGCVQGTSPSRLRDASAMVFFAQSAFSVCLAGASEASPTSEWRKRRQKAPSKMTAGPTYQNCLFDCKW